MASASSGQTTYTWSIEKLYTKPEGGENEFVVTAVFAVAATDGTYTGESLHNRQDFSYTAGNPVTPFADLTEAQVIGWVKDALGPNGVASYQACVAGLVNYQKNPPVLPEEQPLPWVPSGNSGD